jgi:hypothetical protein
MTVPADRNRWAISWSTRCCVNAEEEPMSTSKKPLKPDDFPVSAEDKEVKKQDGTTIANTNDSAVADDVAERLNEDEARREQDKWSA